MTNTLPDNFLWEKQSDYVTAVAPGLYEIAYGFFSGAKPEIKVLVNEEIVISASQPDKPTKKSFEILPKNKETVTGKFFI